MSDAGARPAAGHATDRTAAAIPAAPETLGLRRVYIFLTRHGLALSAMVAVILVGAINYDNALGYLLAFLLGAVLLVTILHTYRNLAGLTFTGAHASPVFAGEAAWFELGFADRPGRSHFALEIEPAPQRARGRREPGDLAPVRLDLTGAGPAQARLGVPARARGWLGLDRIRVTSVFPLGMVRSWAYFATPARCLVYPRIAGKLPLPTTVFDASTVSTGTGAGSDDFTGLRAYAPGDPPRAIAWKSLAKDQDVVVKRFVGGGEARVWLSWAQTSSLPDIEARLSQLTRWVVDADRTGAAYGLDLPGIRIPLASGHAHRARCLAALALFGTDEAGR